MLKEVQKWKQEVQHDYMCSWTYSFHFKCSFITEYETELYAKVPGAETTLINQERVGRRWMEDTKTTFCSVETWGFIPEAALPAWFCFFF